MDSEDVVLWRALSAQRPGRYVEVTPGGPAETSPLRAFHDAGWQGVLVVDPALHGAAAIARPGARVLASVDELTGVVGRCHLLAVPDADALTRALAALPEAPWVVHVARAGEEPLAVEGYTWCLTVGDVQLLVADAHADALGRRLSTPPSSHDGFVRASEERLRAERDAALESLMRWRAQALAGWPGEVAGPGANQQAAAAQAMAEHLSRELDALRHTVSWRVTRPLRTVYRASSVVRRLRER